MRILFPRTKVENISVSRMIIGTNWMAGFSHRTSAADNLILNTHATVESMVPMLETFLENGVDTIMGPFSQLPLICNALEKASERTGQPFIMVDTPIINIEDSAAGRRDAESVIKNGKKLGAEICLLHHASIEQLVNKREHCIERLDDYTSMIRDAGMIPGVCAHMPEVIIYSDYNEYDVQTYNQIYNCMGFMMQVEIETVNQIIYEAKKPVMTIKPMAAGRCTPFVGLNFSWATIRNCDMVTVGCFNKEEAAEDIEISMAALEGRRAEIGKRNSPDNTQDAFGKH